MFLFPFAERFAVEEQLRLVAGSEHMHRRDLAGALRPVPMGQDVNHGQIGPPSGLVEVEQILLEAAQVNDAEIGTARRHRRSGPRLPVPSPFSLRLGIGEV